MLILAHRRNGPVPLDGQAFPHPGIAAGFARHRIHSVADLEVGRTSGRRVPRARFGGGLGDRPQAEALLPRLLRAPSEG